MQRILQFIHLSGFAFLIPLLVSTFLGLGYSVNKPLSATRFWFLLMGLAAFVVVVSYGSRQTTNTQIAILIIIVSPTVAILSLIATDWASGALLKPLTVTKRYPLLLQLSGSGVPNNTNGINPRLVGGTMAFLLPLPLSLFVFGDGRRLRLLGLLTAAIVAYPLLLSQSPQAILGVTLAIALILAWRVRRSLFLQVPLALSMTMAWILRDHWLPAALVDRLELGINARLQIWPAAWLMLRDMPFTGVGLNNFPIVNDLYALLPAAQPHAHNFFLQTALDLGLLGLVAVIALFALAFRAAWRAYHASDNANFRAVMLGCAGAFAAFIGFGLWDAITLGHKPAPALWVMLGLVFAGERITSPRPSPALSLRARRRLLVGLGLFTLLLSPIWSSALSLNLARTIWLQTRAVEAPAKAVLSEQVQALTQLSIDLYPDNSRAHLFRGQQALASNETDIALHHLQRAITHDPRDFQTHFYLAETLFGLGNLDSAIVHWKAAGADELLHRRGHAARDSGNLILARQWYTLTTQVAPNHYRAHLALARTLREQKNWIAAGEVYASLMSRFPDEQAGYTEYANLLYEQQEQPQAALEVINNGLARFREKAPYLYYLRSRLAFDAGNVSDAIVDAEAAIQLAPQNGAYLVWLGDLYRQDEQYQQALQQYQHAIQQTSDKQWIWRAHQRMGWIFSAQQSWSEAVQAQQLSITNALNQGATPSQLSQLYLSLGQAYQDAGHTPTAIEAYHQALVYNPNNQVAQNRLDSLTGIAK